MNRRILLLAVMSLVMAGVALAHDHDHPTTAPTTAPTTQPKAVNAMCPVQTNNPVDDRETIMYKGQCIGFCCPDCKEAFEKNPDKYIGNVDTK